MKFLKSYRGAGVVLVVVIVLSVLLGSHRSLTAERREVEEIFFEGVGGSSGSIATDLEARRAIGINLLSIGSRYLEKGELKSLNEAVEGLGKTDDLKELYRWNLALGERAEQLMLLLETCPLSEKDAEYIQGFRTDLAARADTIARDPYNERAEEFNSRVLGAFPANLLSRITFVREAQIFS